MTVVHDRWNTIEWTCHRSPVPEAYGLTWSLVATGKVLLGIGLSIRHSAKKILNITLKIIRNIRIRPTA